MAFNKIQLIKKNVGKAIEPYGFSVESSGDKEVVFKRAVGKSKQYIYIDYAFLFHLRLQFTTTIYKSPIIDGAMLVRMADRGYIEFLEPILCMWKYAEFPDYLIKRKECEEEAKSNFLAILEILKGIIIQYGLDGFEKLKTYRKEIRPNLESDAELYHNHNELNLRYRKLLGVEGEKDTEKVITVITDKIQEIKEQEVIEAAPLLIGLAAIYGEEIASKRGWQWQWDEEDEVCLIKNTGVRVNGWNSEDPLEAVFRLWKGWRNDKRRFFYLLKEFVAENLYADKLKKPSELWMQEARLEGCDYDMHCNHGELNSNYRKSLGIENEKDTEKVIEAINSKILSIRGQDIHKVKEDIIGLAAVYGEEVISKCGGVWQLIKVIGQENKSYILGLHGRICKRVNPLNDVIRYFGSEGEDKDFFMEPFYIDDDIFV